MLIKRSISRVTARPDLRHRPAESPVKALVEADTVCQPHHPVRMVPALSMGSALVLQSMCWKRMDYPTAGHHWELWAPTQTLLQANVLTVAPQRCALRLLHDLCAMSLKPAMDEPVRVPMFLKTVYPGLPARLL